MRWLNANKNVRFLRGVGDLVVVVLLITSCNVLPPSRFPIPVDNTAAEAATKKTEYEAVKKAEDEAKAARKAAEDKTHARKIESLVTESSKSKRELNHFPHNSSGYIPVSSVTPPILGYPLQKQVRIENLVGNPIGNIAFNVPDELNLDDTAIIQLKLGLDTTIDQLSVMITSSGKKEGAHIEVSDRMEANLKGSNFTITPVTPEIQAINKAGITEWKWEIRPKSEGKQHLHLVVSMRFKVDGESVERAVQTFDKEIEIEVTKWQQVSGFFKGNWQWLWTAILLPAFIWLRKKKQTAKTESKDV